MGFSQIDGLIVILYFVLTLIVLLLFRKKSNTTEEYFLAGRNVGWFVVGTAVFASNFGSEHVMGNMSSGYNNGLKYGGYEWMASLVLVFMVWFLVPILIKSKVITVTEYFEKRFDSRTRWILSIISIVAYVVTKISITLLAGAILLKDITGLNIYTSSLIFVLITGVYTMIGGLRSVMYTQALQTIIIIGGSIVLTIVCINQIGGVGVFVDSTSSEMWKMVKGFKDVDIPWTGVLFGMPILAIWYWSTDQYIIQRVLASKDIKTARKGLLFTSFLKIIPVFTFIIPGMIMATQIALNHQTNVSVVDIPTNTEPFSYFTMLVLPSGMKGIAITILLAALMSSLAASFSSASSLFTFDIYKKLYPKSTDFQLYNVGQLSTLVVLIFGIVWIPIINNSSTNSIEYLQKVQAHISAPIAAVFIIGVFWKKATGNAAFYSLLIGFSIGILRILLDLMQLKTGVALIDEVIYMNFLHFSIVLFLITVCFIVFFTFKDINGNKNIEINNSLIFQRSQLKFDKTLVVISVLIVGLVIFLWFFIGF